MKVDVKEIHSVFAWSWHIPKNSKDGQIDENDDDDDVCGICRAGYNATCPSCKYPGDECSLVVGECNHNFHVHCIYRWLDTTTSRGLCPMCRQVFQLKRGLAINDSQLDKFRELQARKRTGTAGEFADDADDEEAIVRAVGQQDQPETVDDQGDVIMDQGLVVR